MVTIRPATEIDKPDIVEFAESHGFDTPFSEFVLLAIEDDNIVGMIGLDRVFTVEPLIARSAQVAQKLYDTMIGAAYGLGANRIECLVRADNTRMKPILDKLGFKFVESIHRFCKVLINPNG